MTPFDTGLDKDHPPDERTRKELLSQAIEAANAGDIRKALENLYQGYHLDGIYRGIQSKWQKLSKDEVDDSVAQAVVQLLEKAAKGDRILRPKAYLYKVADGVANNIWRDNKTKISISAGEVKQNIESGSNAHNDLEKDKRKALSIARNLLPKLGQTNVQLVMEYIFDAVELDVTDLSNQEISEALTLSPDIVRQSKSRGWRRLARVAEDEGYSLDLEFLEKRPDAQNGESYE